MTMEIELKAHVRDYEALRLILIEKSEYRMIFEKEDQYWFLEKTPDFPPFSLRMRRETRGLPDGTKETLTFATYKIKQVKDGIEINDEREFEIRSSSGPGEAEFEELLRRLRLKPGINKRKKGWSFLWEDITAELTEVEGLGWFIELELLADNNREDTVALGREKLLNFLDKIGVERTAIESRFYSEMLSAKL